jgi:pyocin large subunit-like protein
VVTGGGLAVCAAMYADDVLNKIGISNFVDPGLVTDYFLDHGAKLGYRTEREYLLGARNLTKGGEGIEKLFRKSDGATLFYNKATKEFAVLHKNGTIGTYMYVKSGWAYWFKQIRKSK